MVKREDKLKSLLGGKSKKVESVGPMEINLNGGISPVAKIKVV